MNITIPHIWLKDFLETKVAPHEIARDLSLYGPTVESLVEIDKNYVYQIEITPNRTDLMSIEGVARESAAILNREKNQARFVPLEILDKVKQSKTDLPLIIECEDRTLMPQMMAIVLDNIQILNSPKDLKIRLELTGNRALANVVDISNFVRISLGHPLHIFDYDAVKGNLLRTRESREGEVIETLDGTTRQIPSGSIIIEDSERIIDLCGIMGGKNSEVTETTKRVVVFVPIYEASRIRKTFRALNHATDSALIYEKGIDPTLTKRAFMETLNLLEKLAGGKVASKEFSWFIVPEKPTSIKLSQIQLESVLNEKISKAKVIHYLESLGMKVMENQDGYLVTPPSNRIGDIKIPEDLIEEIARLHGLMNLRVTMPGGRIPEEVTSSQFQFERIIENHLATFGLTECYSESATSLANCSSLSLADKDLVHIDNPLIADRSVMRPNLLCNLLPAVSNNLSRFETVAIFEKERIFKAVGDDLPMEINSLTCVLSAPETDQLFYTLRGIGEMLLDALQIEKFSITKSQTTKPYLMKNKACDLLDLTGQILLRVGQLKPSVAEKFGIHVPTVILEGEVDLLVSAASKLRKLPLTLNHPGVVEDLSFIVPFQTQVGDMKEQAKTELQTICELSEIKIADLYDTVDLRSKNQKGVTMTVLYQGKDKTPNPELVAKAREAVIEKIQNTFQAQIRSN
ncbi:phenylalanine--tRNA ligase subunit beta [candidate division WWE3 bacterium RIFCSPLOWO2_01_FULL_42_11]|uniref:phenylalanine--tRNA ligase n=1 Tax=candidate division WWE3 bacterium RIFCSPLOWO2_01_FULL_42_11 TaxID=1802627 RepID=A0A1F4VSF5_UNCKA|nr:MAG: phenylalanine--tRNA ligase subunit beta [candidate division WWE3 bacterium RIFCSPLOWO2_01_FULL_42_11]